MINNTKLHISTANTRTSTDWKQEEIWWSDLIDKFSKPMRTHELFRVYLSMKKAEQDSLKDVGGFVGGRLSGSRRLDRNVLDRCLITLDLDNIHAGGAPEVLGKVHSLRCGFAVYSTRKHEAAKPRLRIIIPLSRPVTAEEYEPIARKLAECIGIRWCDPTTFQASRLMYWPSCSSDSEFVFDCADRPFVDPDGVLGMYNNWHNHLEWPEVPGAPAIPKSLSVKQEDPLTKSGLVGAFCRTYSINEAISKFLPGAYTEESSDRLTYAGGSTSSGAVIYDDKYLYSHHATDPASGKLCNAFDLVRLHLFGDKDDEALPGTPNNRLPSYTLMNDLASKDENVRIRMNKERVESAAADFGQTVNIEDDEWMRLLTFDANGNFKKTTENIMIILRNDISLKDHFIYDEFACRALVRGSVPWDRENMERVLSDIDDAGLRHYLERAYNITGREKVYDALSLHVHANAFNEIKDYLNSLVWDGVPRLNTLLHDYLGAEQSEYTAAVMRKSLAAAVGRIFRPGLKYDYMPILSGAQGVGKSTFLKILGGKWFSDGLTVFEGKEASELIQGKWLIEIGELTGFSKADTNAIKQFLSRTEDTYREAYGRRTNDYPRKCVFFGTSNESEYLRDTTGNRRFWPVDVGEFEPTKSVFEDLSNERDQVWAEAVAVYKCGEPLYMTKELEDYALSAQETKMEQSAKEGIVRDFAEKLVPVDWNGRTKEQRAAYWAFEHKDYKGELVPRDRICAAEVWTECLGGDLKMMRRAETIEINKILERLPRFMKIKTSQRFGCYGVQKGFLKKGD